jgi:two-component system, OmpR family, phosphate regulon response regulator PhoB
MVPVLIADDDSSTRRLIRATLECDSYLLLEARDGDEAWQLLRQHHPRVAILDINMPGRSGLALTRDIRATPDLAATHVIILTAKAQMTDVATGAAVGADAYLTKPFSPLELLTLVDAACTAPVASPEPLRRAGARSHDSAVRPSHGSHDGLAAPPTDQNTRPAPLAPDVQGYLFVSTPDPGVVSSPVSA